MKSLRKPTRIEKGLLLAVVWLYQDSDQPSVAANLARGYGLNALDLSDASDFDKHVFQKMNDAEGTKFIIHNANSAGTAAHERKTI
jgi:hypothetical protein